LFSFNYCLTNLQQPPYGKQLEMFEKILKENKRLNGELQRVEKILKESKVSDSINSNDVTPKGLNQSNIEACISLF